ncbi:hypothetical protein M8C21_002898, partial [Ambrosia artemisiifolia]
MSVLKDSKHLKIPLKEIEIATKNFQECIGKGGYGMVYKGELLVDGKSTTVAVKRLNEQFGQGLKEFLMEIQLLTGERPSMDLVTKELEELLQIQLSSYALESPRENSFSHEASYGSVFKMQGFHKTLQIRADNVINNLDTGIEDRSLSFDIEKEVNLFVMEMNQDERKVALNLKLVKLVDDYQEINTQTSGLYDSLSTCLRRVRGTRLLILEALRHVDDEDHGNEENRYERALDHLKSFKAAGDPFTQDFFRIFNFVYRRQIAFLEKLQRKNVKLSKKLDQTWLRKRFSSVLKHYKNNDIKWQKEVISFMQVVSYIEIKDTGRIQFLVNKLQMDIENFMRNAEFAIKMKDAVKYVIENMTEKLNTFLKNVDELEEMANICTVNIQKAKTVNRI